MSTYYATFKSMRDGHETVSELLRDGIPPENISLIAEFGRESGAKGTATTNQARLGDASFIVGRSDDPEPSEEANQRLAVAAAPLLLSDEIGGADSSDETLDVDSLDQADESQEMAEESLYPVGGLSHATHESDDFRSQVNTGFSARFQRLDDVYESEMPLEEQNIEAMEAISVPGGGVVIGSGALATAALDLLDETKPGASAAFVRFLIDDGVPRSNADSYREALAEGEAMLAVEIVPGRTREDHVESIVEKHLGQNAQLFDGHRFRENSRRLQRGKIQG